MTPSHRGTDHAAHLFVPAVRQDLAGKAPRTGATAIIVDLEDSVPMTAKAAARGDLPSVLDPARAAGRSVYVRVNNEPALLRDDLTAALAAGVTGLVLPKAESVEQLRAIDGWISEFERQAHKPVGSTELELQVETAVGLLQAPQLAAALERTTSIMLGVEDFSTEMGVDPNDPQADLTWAHAHVLLAAVAAGIAPYGLIGAFSNYQDTATYSEVARRSRAFGYVGAYCIHPAQVALAIDAFSLSRQQVEQATRIVRAYEDAEAQGRSATALDGKMIDRPIAERARRLLQRAGASVGMNQ